MSERSVAVRLTARIDQYVAAMNAAKQSTEGFSKNSEANLKKVGTQISNVGSTMTRGVTLPIIGAGAAALKLSTDFNTAFGQMVGLAGVAAEDVDGLKESVLDLAGETAVAPRELAEALYFASSAGLDTAGAMDAVTVAAHASAAGLGSTQDVVGLVASAVASYGEANITAAEATDILVATIREGRAEPAELASTLGRVLPIASQLGVSFEEVGGTVAYLSNVFGDTNRTVTATQGLFVKLVSPSQQGRDALAEMGTSVEDLNAAIAQDGLLGALDLLREKGFAGNQQALRALFDDIEGYQAALALLNADQADLTGVMEATGNAAGSTGEAFAAIDEDAMALRQSWVDIQIALIAVGDAIGPIVAQMAGGIGDIAGAFAELDPWLQGSIIGIAGLAAAVGPLLMVVGSLIRNYTALKGAMVAYNATAVGQKVSAGALAGALGGIGIALTAAVLVYDSYNTKKREAKQRTDEFVAALEAEASGQADAVDAMLARKLAELAGAFEATGLSAVDAARYIKGENVPAMEALSAAFDTAGGSGSAMKRILEDQGYTIKGNGDALLTLAGAVGESRATAVAANRVFEATKGTMTGLGETTDAAAEAADGQTEAVSANTVAQQDAARYVAKARAEYEAEQRAHDEAKTAALAHKEALAELFAEIITGLDSQFDYESATLAMQEASLGLADQEAKTAEVMANSEATDREKQQSLIDLEQERIANAEQALEQAKAYAVEQGAQEGSKYEAQLMREELGRLKAVYPELGDLIDEYIAKLNLIPTERVTRIRIEGFGTNIIVDENDNVRSGRADGGPVYPGGLYPILERGEPEMLTTSRGTYLMSPPGMVTPMKAMGSGMDREALTAAFRDVVKDLPSGPLVEVGAVHDYSGTSVESMLRTANTLMVMS